jgi:hypothetical protein
MRPALELSEQDKRRTLLRLYRRYVEIDDEGRATYRKRDRVARKIHRLLGGKALAKFKISEVRGVKVLDRFKTKEDKIFTKAYCHRIHIEEFTWKK